MATKSTTEITSSNFEQIVDRDGIVLIDWWAPWCGPCRMFGPTYEKVAGKHPEMVFGKVNTEEDPELAGAFNIRSIPTLMVFRDRVLVFSQPGMLPEHVLEDLIGKVQALDMSKVRAEIAAHDKQHGHDRGGGKSKHRDAQA